MFIRTHNLGLFALLTTIVLNTLSLHFLRSVAGSAVEGLLILALGYVPMAVVFWLRPKVSTQGKLSDWLWILTWSASVSSIYLLFLVYPQSISVAQLIIAQSLAPIVAVFLTGDFRSKQQESWFRLAPLALLFLLAYLQKGSASFNGFAFAGLCFAFLMVQTAMRGLSKLQSPGWVLPRFAGLTFVMLIVLVMCFKPLDQISTNGLSFLMSVALMSLALLLIQFGYLFGLSKTPALLAAIGLSSSVPVAIIIGFVLSVQKVDWLQMMLSIAYCLCIAYISVKSTRWKEPNMPKTKPKEEGLEISQSA